LLARGVVIRLASKLGPRQVTSSSLTISPAHHVVLATSRLVSRDAPPQVSVRGLRRVPENVHTHSTATAQCPARPTPGQCRVDSLTPPSSPGSIPLAALLAACSTSPGGRLQSQVPPGRWRHSTAATMSLASVCIIRLLGPRDQDRREQVRVESNDEEPRKEHLDVAVPTRQAQVLDHPSASDPQVLSRTFRQLIGC